MRLRIDKDFISMFDERNGHYFRSGAIKDGAETKEDPFMSSFPELLDVGIMGHCAHGRSGLCVPICYNKDKSGNPLKIKEKRTCPCSFSNHIPGKIRPQRPWTERGCCIKDKAKFTKSRARTCKHRKQNTAVQRNCRSSAPAQVNRPPTQWTASTPQDQYTLFQGNTQEKSCGWTAPSCVSFRHRVGPYTLTV